MPISVFNTVSATSHNETRVCERKKFDELFTLWSKIEGLGSRQINDESEYIGL